MTCWISWRSQRRDARQMTAPMIEDRDLDEINSRLPWQAGAPLPDGRILGRLGARPGKRDRAGHIPDRRITRLNEAVPLNDLRVLEVGCFEGIHTVGLCQFSKSVTAVDVRPWNVVKTLTRLACHGASAKVFVHDVERLHDELGHFDVVFHCGVLYHLLNPVEHLLALGRICRRVFLDTHIARDEVELISHQVHGSSYQGAYHVEGGWSDAFSGRHSKSLWLTLDSLKAALTRSGFHRLDLWEMREERNGPRIALLADRA